MPVLSQRYWSNRPAAARVAEERPALRALPSAAIPSYTSYYPVVRLRFHLTRWSVKRFGSALATECGAACLSTYQIVS